MTSSTLLETEEPKTRPGPPPRPITRVASRLWPTAIVRVKSARHRAESDHGGEAEARRHAAGARDPPADEAVCAQDITALLKERGIDYSVKFTSEVFGKVGAPSTKLPLEAFDDASYEVREPQDWLAHGAGAPLQSAGLG